MLHAEVDKNSLFSPSSPLPDFHFPGSSDISVMSLHPLPSLQNALDGFASLVDLSAINTGAGSKTHRL